MTQVEIQGIVESLLKEAGQQEGVSFTLSRAPEAQSSGDWSFDINSRLSPTMVIQIMKWTGRYSRVKREFTVPYPVVFTLEQRGEKVREIQAKIEMIKTEVSC